MTDKVQKIREEVARIQAYTQSDVLKEVLDYIDKVQEEPKPKFKIGDCIKPIESSLGSPRTICEVCDSWYVTNQGTLDFEYEDNWELVEEPVSEPQVKESLISIHDDKTCKENGNSLTQEPTIPDIVDEHYWEMLGEEPVSEDLEKVVEEIVDPTVLNAYGVKEIANRLRRTMIEPVSEEWIKELRTKLDSMSKEDFKKVFDKYAVDCTDKILDAARKQIASEIDSNEIYKNKRDGLRHHRNEVVVFMTGYKEGIEDTLKAIKGE